MGVLMFGFSIMLAIPLVIQAPMNGGLTKSLTHDAFYTCAIIFMVGSALMLIIAIASGAPLPDFGKLGETQWWNWLAGLCGAAYVTITTIVTPKVGSAVTMVMVIVGRVIFATCIDVFGWFGATVMPLGWPSIVGLLLVIIGATVVGTAKNETPQKDIPAQVPAAKEA